MKIQSNAVARSNVNVPVYGAIWYVWGIVEVLLAIRGVINIFGAYPGGQFANTMYAVSEPFVLPFQSVLVAMIVYFFVARGFIEFLQFAQAANVNEVMVSIDRA